MSTFDKNQDSIGSKIKSFFFGSDTGKIMFAMILAIVAGVIANMYADPKALQTINDGFFTIVGTMFINSMKMLVVCLIFFCLVVGMTGMDGGSQLKRIALRTFGLFMTTTAVAITFAMSIGLVSGIGEGANMQLPAAGAFAVKDAPEFKDVILNIVPTNVVEAFSTGNNLAIILFAILFGMAVAKRPADSNLKKTFEEVSETILDIVALLMKFAPYGVFALMFKAVSQQGIDTILNVLMYVLLCSSILIAHAFITYGTMLKIHGFTLGQIKMFYKKMKPVWITGFSTSSSSATMPTTLAVAEKSLGVKKQIFGFTIPMGGTINMDGTAVMQGLATIFVANLYAVDLSASDYGLVIATALLASIGTAGVPGVGLIMLGMVFSVVNLPVEGIALIFGVDRLLDMLRTAVNLTGDCAVTMCVAKKEGAIDFDILESEQDELIEADNQVVQPA